jgi:hypothetical protein
VGKKTAGIQFVFLPLLGAAVAQDPGWPRELTRPEGKLIYYQPHFDEWPDFQKLQGRLAFLLTPQGGKATVGLASVDIETEVDISTRTVLLRNPKILETRFPSAGEDEAAKLDPLLKSFISSGATMTISLDRAIAATDKRKATPAAGIKNDPPPIFISYVPSILLIVNGEPVLTPIPNTNLEFMVNSNWPLFSDKSDDRPKYYLLVENQWLESAAVESGWKKARKLPKDFSKIPKEANWDDVRKALPAKNGSRPAPSVFYSATPAELVVFGGPPVYEPMPGTRLSHATNTENDVFFQVETKTFFILLAGRWFRASSLQGPWAFASADLPADFTAIPSGSPAGRVRVSVPGTPEAADAVLLAQVPNRAVVNRHEVESKVKVIYDGEPEFKPIEGTPLSYASNTQERVVKTSEDQYYLCFQAVWFVSTTPKGPWKTAESVPKEIYTIPPSSPIYNITYVTQSTMSDGDIEAAYTAGYVGMYVAGGTLYYGTGWYYPPYMYYGYYGYPIYRPYPYTYGAAVGYNPYTGRYGAVGGVYGPYGGAGWGATYNPSTGTYARGATVYGPGGSRTAAQAYNPYTGTYAATRQGSNPYSQWGGSVVTRGDQWAATGHVTTGAGTVGGIRTSGGGAAIGATGPGGNGVLARTGSGDVYAGKDGNVYKRNADGGWQKYGNGGWSNVNTPAARSESQSGATRQPEQIQNLNREWQNRERGAAQTQRIQQMDRSGWSSHAGTSRAGMRGGGRRR